MEVHGSVPREIENPLKYIGSKLEAIIWTFTYYIFIFPKREVGEKK
jgi:hypothetical protein